MLASEVSRACSACVVVDCASEAMPSRPDAYLLVEKIMG